MKYTGERIIPNNVIDPVSLAEHYSRYYFALQFLRPTDKILDAACGVGYGSDILSRVSQSVIGGDINNESLEYGKSHYANEKLTFQFLDIRDLPFPKNSFDVFTSFETIEHIGDQEIYLSEAVRVLKPGGLFIVSTPNKILYNKGIMPNEFHVKELTSVEFQVLLCQYFNKVQLYGQKYNPHLERAHKIHVFLRRIKQAMKLKFGESPLFDPMDAMDIRIDQAHLSTYIIAICSNR
jgi:2-polyprenyl-3-methyl-5-hydroxy-6-metoxy-1,4-benzoquinol methylase